MLRREDPSSGFRLTLLCLYTGAAVFLLALLLSAILVPELRVLHSLQALMYVAVIVLAHRNRAWVYGAAFSIAVLWNAMGLLITHLIEVGAADFWLMLRSGHAGEIVPVIVMMGGVGHFVLICAAVVAVVRCNSEDRKWWKFAGGGIVSLAYFALLVALFQPH